MDLNWSLITQIASPAIAIIVGVVLDRIIERRVKLVTYYGHVSAFTLRDGSGSEVYTHSIVLRNSGKKTAFDVRIGHNVLPPNHKIFPSVVYNIETQDSGGEIVIPTLVAGEQITISYLYFPPLTWGQINSYVKSNAGFARVLREIPAPQPPKWQRWSTRILTILGLITLIYLLTELCLQLL